MGKSEKKKKAGKTKKVKTNKVKTKKADETADTPEKVMTKKAKDDETADERVKTKKAKPIAAETADAIEPKKDGASATTWTASMEANIDEMLRPYITLGENDTLKEMRHKAYSRVYHRTKTHCKREGQSDISASISARTFANRAILKWQKMIAE